MNSATFSAVCWLLAALSGPLAHAYASEDIPKDTVITLERTGCKGASPEYTLTIAADGTVIFKGHRHVERIGRYKNRVDAEKVSELVRTFEKVLSRRDSGRATKDDCDEIVDDAPIVKTSMHINGRTRTLYHILGCWKGNGYAPLELDGLEKMIDEVAGSEKWITARSQSSLSAESPEWLNQLIIKFQNDSRSGRKDFDLLNLPPQSILRYEYKDQFVYHFIAQCCDFYNWLYDANGKRICATGGLSGRGDGRCPDFFTHSYNEELVWENRRRW